MRMRPVGGAFACAVVMAIVVAAVAPVSVFAQARPAPAAVTSIRPVLPADSTPGSWKFEQCMGGLTYGAPLKWALSYGMGLVSENPDTDWCVLGAAKLGLGGAGLHIGVANAFAQFGSGVALTVGAIRTFDQPLNALARRTYVGASVHAWPILAVGGELGWYARVGDDPVGSAMPRALWVWSTGFGF